MHRFLLALSLLTVACGGKQQVEPPKPPEPPKLEVDGNARLTDSVVPTAYRLDLTIDPAKESFSGRAEIDIDVREATHGIIVHADELTVTSATLLRGDTTYDAHLQPGENNGLGLAFIEPVETGKATLIFEYSAPLDEVTTGLYRVKDDDDWYAFTQFEPLEARQAFPGFDEPKFKTPFQVTMRVPTGQIAVTNTPETERKTEGEVDVVKFAESRPLPTYLVAFAVGPFDVVETPADTIEGVPFRLIATKGKAKLGSFMLENTPILLKELTDYFGQPYPYQKLDIIAVPNFSAGAMENVGLITFRETLLLLDPKTVSVQQKLSAMGVMAHELAHMWFGNLVTLPWWEDLWLNEGFATWMASKVIDSVMPELEGPVSRAGKSWVINADSRAQARPIRQTIEHGGDVRNAFGAIAYGKGAAVLRLFEAWMGEEVMREAVRAYIKANEHGTGTTQQLLAAFDAASGKPVTQAMGTFLDQPGAPLLSTKLLCEKDKTPSVTIEQSRYLPAGSQADQTGPWEVPVCIAWPEGRQTKRHCELVTGKSATIELPTQKCPAWYYPNAGQVGYYRWTTEDENLAKIAGGKAFKKFDDATKVEIFTNLSALSNAEVITAQRYLETVRRMSGEKHRAIIRLAVRALYGVEDAVPDERRAEFEKRVTKLLRPHLKRVGYEPKDGEAIERSILRPTVVEAAAFLAKDEKVVTWAKDAASRFVKQMDSVDEGTVRLAVPIAAWDAEASLWLSYKLAIDNAPTPGGRVAAISGLGSVRNAKLLQKSLDLFFTSSLRSQDMWSLIGPTFETDETFAVTWGWFKVNYDKIVDKIGPKSIPRLPGVGSGFCSAEGRKEVEDFFTDPAHRAPGTERNLANTLESIDQCVRRRAYLLKGLDGLLK